MLCPIPQGMKRSARRASAPAAKRVATRASKVQEHHLYTIVLCGGEDLAVKLPAARVTADELKQGISKENGVRQHRQELYMIAQSTDGKPVREHDAEPVELYSGARKEKQRHPEERA